MAFQGMDAPIHAATSGTMQNNVPASFWLSDARQWALFLRPPEVMDATVKDELFIRTEKKGVMHREFHP